MIVKTLTVNDLGPQFRIVNGKVNLKIDGTTLTQGTDGTLSSVGGGTSTTPGGGTGTPVPLPPSLTQAANATEAARFLVQATPGFTSSDITALQGTTYDTWITNQMNTARTQNHIDWLVAHGHLDNDEGEVSKGTIDSIWRKYISGPDQLRMRATLAWSELFATSINLGSSNWTTASSAAFADRLEANALGNFKTLLTEVTYSYHMSKYLTWLENQKASATTHPDENYAREIMQLFTIGLDMLNMDGTPVIVNGARVPTYVQDDVSTIARIFTGYQPDYSGVPYARGFNNVTNEFFYGANDNGAKTFMGSGFIAAGANTRAYADAGIAYIINFLFNHQNTAPFISKFLIQRFVTSNPSPSYVARVAAKFADNGNGVRGDLKAVIRAVLMDVEARNTSLVTSTVGAKLREPMVVFMHLARILKVASPDGYWTGQYTYSDFGISPGPTDLNRHMGQSPHNSPSVFNFFRPQYVPPASDLGASGYFAPELQILNESTIPTMLNFFYGFLNGTYFTELTRDYSEYTNLASDTTALMTKINIDLAAGQLPTADMNTIITAINSMPTTTNDNKLNKVKTALYLTIASPAFFAQR